MRSRIAELQQTHWRVARQLGAIALRPTASAAVEAPLAEAFAGKIELTAPCGARLYCVERRLAAQAEIVGWTASAEVRQAGFRGLRECKAATEVHRER